MLSLRLFPLLTVTFAAQSPVPDSGSQPKSVRLVVEPNGDVTPAQPVRHDEVKPAQAVRHDEVKPAQPVRHEPTGEDVPAQPVQKHTVTGSRLSKEDRAYLDRQVHKKKGQPQFDGLKPEKVDAALRSEMPTMKPHKHHDSGPHPSPVEHTALEETNPYQYDTDPTYCWGDGGVNKWTIVTQYQEGELPYDYELGLRKNRRSYARKHNYEYCEFKMKLIGIDGWDKLAAVNSLLRRRRGKVLMMDTDSLIMNMDISLEEIEKKHRHDKDVVFATDVYDPRGKVDAFNSSLTSGVLMVWNGIWAQNFFLDWMLYLQDDEYMATNYSKTGWSDYHHGFLDKEQTALLHYRAKNQQEWDVFVGVVSWDVLSSPYPAPIDTGDRKWKSDPTWRFQPGDFILHPHGRNSLYSTLYRDLLSMRTSCALSGVAATPCRRFEKSDNKFSLNFPSYFGKTTEEWAAETAVLKANAIKYGIPIVVVIVFLSACLSWYLRKKAIAQRENA